MDDKIREAFDKTDHDADYYYAFKSGYASRNQEVESLRIQFSHDIEAYQQQLEKLEQVKKKLESKVLDIVDKCFHAYAPCYRSDAKNMATDLLLS